MYPPIAPTTAPITGRKLNFGFFFSGADDMSVCCCSVMVAGYWLLVTGCLSLVTGFKSHVSSLKSQVSSLTSQVYFNLTIVIPCPPLSTCASPKCSTSSTVCRYSRRTLRRMPSPFPCRMLTSLTLRRIASSR